MADWQDFLALADKQVPGYRAAFIKTVATASSGLKASALRALFKAGQYNEITTLVSNAWKDAAAGWENTLTKQALSTLGAGGELAAASTKLVGGFDTLNPAAISWAKNHSAVLVKDITDAQVEAIRNIIAKGQAGEYTVEAAGRQIRNVVGLDPRRAGALAKFDASLAERVARMTAQGATPAKVSKALARSEQAVDRYRSKLLASRAETIARTESISAAVEGQLQAWNQGVAHGKITATALKRWITTPDDRRCKTICRPMNGVKVPVGQDFSTPAGMRKGPPAHPNCRCALGLLRGPKGPLTGPGGAVSAPVAWKDVTTWELAGTYSGRGAAWRKLKQVRDAGNRDAVAVLNPEGKFEVRIPSAGRPPITPPLPPPRPVPGTNVWTNPNYKLASDISGVTPAEPVENWTAYHITRVENVDAILKDGFDLSKVKPRWVNDKAVSLSRTREDVVAWFTGEGREAERRLHHPGGQGPGPDHGEPEAVVWAERCRGVSAADDRARARRASAARRGCPLRSQPAGDPEYRARAEHHREGRTQAAASSASSPATHRAGAGAEADLR